MMDNIIQKSRVCIDGGKLRDVMTGVTLEVEQQTEKTDEHNDCFEKNEIIKNMSYACEGDDSGDDDTDDLPFARMAKRMDDISGDGGVLKLVLKAGAGKVVPEDSIVRVHYNAYLEMGCEPYDSTRLRNKAHKFRLGSQELMTGFDFAVATMSKGELSRYLIRSDYAYGEAGCPPRIPQNSTVMMEIELLSFIEEGRVEDFFHLTNQERGKLTFDEITKVCNSQREEGNIFVKEGQWYRASIKYKKAIDILEAVNLKNATEELGQKKILLKLYLNQALCCLKQSSYPHVIHLCSQALEIDPRNVKAMFRKAQAMRKLTEFERAKEWLVKARKLEPNSSDISRELELLSKDVKNFKLMEKTRYKRMFRNPVPKDGESTGTGIEEVEKNQSENVPEENDSHEASKVDILTSVSQEFQNMVTSKLEEYKTSEEELELPFPACNLTVPEIGFLFQAAHDLDLGVKQIGEGYNLRLRVYKKAKTVD